MEDKVCECGLMGEWDGEENETTFFNPRIGIMTRGGMPYFGRRLPRRGGDRYGQ